MELKRIGKINTNNGFQICIDEKYKEGLKGIEGFGHLIIIWWADKVDTDSCKVLTIEKPYKSGPDTVGVFATRSPYRPNSICVSIIDVQSIDYENGIIYTSYTDAEDGTPVLDIKPYYPCSDIIRDVALPEWCEGLPICVEDSGDFDWSSYFNF